MTEEKISAETLRIVELLNVIKNNFNYESYEDYRNILLVLNSCIKDQQVDEEILVPLLEILNNIENKKIFPHNNGCEYVDFYLPKLEDSKKEKEKNVLNTEKLHEILDENLKKIFSYRVLCPLDRDYNYIPIHKKEFE